MAVWDSNLAQIGIVFAYIQGGGQNMNLMVLLGNSFKHTLHNKSIIESIHNAVMKFFKT